MLCLWRMAERGNRGAARELEGAERELGRSRVHSRLRRSRVAASPLTHAGFSRFFSRAALIPPATQANEREKRGRKEGGKKEGGKEERTNKQTIG